MRGWLLHTWVDSSATSAIHTASCAGVEAVEGAAVEVELVAQHEHQVSHFGALRQRSLQYFTSLQFFAQALRQPIGRPQC
jgi:hypothetical protein